MTRIMVFGTFDLLHPGHLDLFRQARALADEPYLIVSIARDSEVERIKGRQAKLTETERALRVKTSDLVNEVVLGDSDGSMAHIRAAKPDIIALGYDQESDYVTRLPEVLANMGLVTKIVRLEPFHPEMYKSSRLG